MSQGGRLRRRPPTGDPATDNAAKDDYYSASEHSSALDPVGPSVDDPDHRPDDEPEEADEPDADPTPSSGSSGRTWSAPSAPAAVNTGAGWVLGLLLWGWVVLPFVKGGPAGVKNVFLAKFLNKAPDGSRLP